MKKFLAAIVAREKTVFIIAGCLLPRDWRERESFLFPTNFRIINLFEETESEGEESDRGR